MAGGVPVVYRKSGENLLTNYDYTNIASGEGYVSYYAGRNLSGSHVLSSNSFYSTYVYNVQDSTQQTDAAVLIDVDFDTTTFNLPRLMKGTALITIPFGWYHGSNTSTNTYVVLTLYIVDGTTETQVGTVTGSTWNTSGSRACLQTLSMTIPETHIKRGQFLRLNVQLHGWNAAGQANYYLLAHDPKGRIKAPMDDQTHIFVDATVTIVTLFQMDIPFKIDL